MHDTALPNHTILTKCDRRLQPSVRTNLSAAFNHAQWTDPRAGVNVCRGMDNSTWMNFGLIIWRLLRTPKLGQSSEIVVWVVCHDASPTGLSLSG